MDIEALIKREAPSDDTHDREYAMELRDAFESYEDSSSAFLHEQLKLARKMFARFGATHYNTAQCVVLTELLKDHSQ